MPALLQPVMEQQEKLRYESQSQTLRAELKTWETTFAKTHEGKKPSRADIKSAPDIAQKYKEYNRIRDVLSGKTAPITSTTQQQQQIPTPRKRKTADHTTPSKRTRTTATPSKRTSYSSNLTTPSTARKLFGTPGSVNVPTSIGPTPQRDGRVLGLFDLLTASPSGARTPSKRTGATPAATATPRRRGGATINPADPGSSMAARLARTPLSSGKRHMLDSFMTPLGRRDGNAAATAAAPDNAGLDRTPSSSSRARDDRSDFATPQFLRRLPPAPVPVRLDENGEASEMPEDDDYDYEAETRRYAARLPRKPLVRGLSSVVASLRKMEEDNLDDDLDALREMEAADMEGSGYQSKPRSKPTTATAEVMGGQSRESGGDEQQEGEDVPRHVEVADSQVMATNLLGGFDDEGIYDSPDDDVNAGLDRNKQPLRVFKKKGQKRTTRRSNMRPVRSKRPASTAAGAGLQDSASEDEDVVPETQHHLDGPPVQDDDGEMSLQSGSEFDGEEGGEDDAELRQSRGRKGKEKVKAKGKGGAKTAAPAGEEKGGKKDGKVVRAVKKVSAMAHQNFRRLKLRNNGAKGGPGFNSKFRRRR